MARRTAKASRRTKSRGKASASTRLLRANRELRRQLTEAQDALRAIREGQVDALVVEGAQGPQVFSVTGAETVYRLAVETMREAALNVTASGTILFCNARFGDFVAARLEQVPGRNLADFVHVADRDRFQALLKKCAQQPVQERIVFTASDGALRPVLLSGSALSHAEGVSLCLVAADLTEIESASQQIELLLQRQRAAEQEQAAQRLVEISRRVVEAQEEERRRLARELHDCTSPDLVALALNCELIKADLPPECAPAFASRLADTQALAKKAISAMRQISSDLHPAVLEHAGLVDGLRSYADEFARRTGIAVSFAAPASALPLAVDKQTALFRIAQEALTNCLKHSRAKNIAIALGNDAKGVTMSIADDGVGFNPSALGRSGRMPGVGLVTMRERAEFGGGEFRVTSARGQGTRISVTLRTVAD